MADSDLVSLTAITAPATTDIAYLVADPAGTPADRKVTIANLAAAAFGTWSTYTPTWTASSNPAIGNGTLKGFHMKVGKWGYLQITMVAGSTTTFGSGAWIFSLPSGWTGRTDASTRQVPLTGWLFDSSAGNHYLAGARVDSAATATSAIFQASSQSLVAATVPFTWATSDELQLTGIVALD